MSHEYTIWFWWSVAATLAVIFLAAILSTYMRKRAERYARDTVRNLSYLHSVLQRVLLKTTANRGIIWILHNGGERISLHTKRYVTVLEEVNDNTISEVKSDYDRFLIDPEFIHAISRLIDGGSTLLDINDLPPSILKHLLSKDGIKQSYLYYIGWYNNCHYFGSFSTKKEGGFYEESQYVELLIAAQKVQKLYGGRSLLFLNQTNT